MLLRHQHNPSRQLQAGFAAVAYIMVGITLAAGLAAALVMSSNSFGRTTHRIRDIQDIQAQINYISSKISECASLYQSSNTSLSDIERRYPSDRVRSIIELECPGLRERYCPTAAETTPCTEARVFKNMPNQDAFSLPDQLFRNTDWEYRLYGTAPTQGVAVEISVRATDKNTKIMQQMATTAHEDLQASFCTVGTSNFLTFDIVLGDTPRCQ